MTLTELRYVVAVDRHRHFGRAAQACFVSQPTLSVGIRKLEEDLGIRIFERNRTEVIVTPVGESVVAQAQTVIEAAERLKETAQAAQDPLGTQLKLGVIYTIGPHLVPRLIPTLKQIAPRLKFIVKENFTDALAIELKHGDLDAAIMSLPFADTVLNHRPVYDEPFVVALPADHLLATAAEIGSADLREQTLLLLGARNCFRDQVIEACPECIAHNSRAPHDLQSTLEGSSLETICQMVASGAGVTVLPSTMQLNDALNAFVAVRPFAAPAPKRTIAIFYRRSFARPEAIECLANAIRAASLDEVEYLG